MDRMEIKSSFKIYSVNFIESLQELERVAENKESFFVIDDKVYALYKDRLPAVPSERLYLMEADENKKNMDMVLAICEQMTGLYSKRNTHLVSIGGGIVQDVTGFVAASLYRGIKWSFYPTTLLASCDSCIGGKTSLNYKGFKNLLGSFYPPDDIQIYPQFFKTLSLQDYCSGMGEVVKFNVIAGKTELEKIERDMDAILEHDYGKLQQYVKNSLVFKKQFIEEDEFDRGIRVLLNFAHTFGHAFEVSSNYAIPHGLAVALGMIAANDISVQRGFISSSYANRIEALCRKLLLSLHIEKAWFTDAVIMQAIHKDKKQTGREISAVLMQKDYSLGLYNDVTEAEIIKAIHRLDTDWG